MKKDQKRRIQQTRMAMRAENRMYPDHLIPVLEEKWPKPRPDGLFQVWRSNKYLVQVYNTDQGILRLSICRTMIAEKGGWEEAITWEQMMQVKRELSLGDMFAAEVYPRDEDVVNVANLRHLWVFSQPLFGWVSGKKDIKCKESTESGNDQPESPISEAPPISSEGGEGIKPT